MLPSASLALALRLIVAGAVKVPFGPVPPVGALSVITGAWFGSALTVTVRFWLVLVVVLAFRLSVAFALIT